MRPNPGGILIGNEIIDRESEIENIWRALSNQSVVLVSERRVGKTCVLRKMEENPKDGWSPIIFWVEGKHLPIEFVEGLYDNLVQKGMFTDKFHGLKKLYKKFVGGEEIGSWKFPQIQENWKTLLETLIEDITKEEKKILFILDELPLMLSNFKQSSGGGHRVAIEFLDTLRGLRNKYEHTKNVAFIFSGSIGINLVIKDLKRNYGYASDPLNNMKIISLSSMTDRGAKELCTRLSDETTFNTKEKEELFNHICKLTDNLPFYIQHVFDIHYDQKVPLFTLESVDNAIDYLHNDPNDIGYFRHYIDRIKTYYDKEMAQISFIILNRVCRSDEYISEGSIIEKVTNDIQVQKEIILETLELLWNDHYLLREIQESGRVYKFRYGILQQWWKKNRSNP